MLKNWLDDHYVDFSEDDELREQFKQLCQRMLHTSTSTLTTGLAKALETLLKKREKQGMNRRLISNVSCPKPIMSSKVTDATFIFEKADELELARQLTIIDFEKFRSIQPRECLNQV